MSAPLAAGRLIACHECDLLHARRALGRHQVARCRRCRAVVYHGPSADLQVSLALTLTALVLFVIVSSHPLLTLQLGGQMETTSLLAAVHALGRADMWALASVVLVTTIVAPALELVGLGYVLAPLPLGLRAPASARIFRWLESVRPWGMIEVYLLGVLVAVVKLSSMATVQAGVALYAFPALVFATAGAVVSLDADALWTRLEGGGDGR